MKNLKNPGRRNIRFLLQILVILMLVAAAVAAKAENLLVQSPDCYFTENGQPVKFESRIGSTAIGLNRNSSDNLFLLQGTDLVVLR